MDLIRSLRATAILGGLAAFLLLTGCSGGGDRMPSGSSGAGGRLALAITDGPSDSWQQVSVVLKSASLRNRLDRSWTQVWTADPANPASGIVNLVDLASVSDLLGKVDVPAGTYDRLMLTIDPDPATMTLVDDSGTAIPAADITVVDPSGRGQIAVVIEPALQVTAGTTASLTADFDLAHPLSIVHETVGGVGKVVLNLQVRLKALPARIQDLQFSRKLGQITAVSASSFTLKDARGASFTYLVDAGTLYRDADAKAAGSLSGLTPDKYALVASNLNADGTLYARRVWYAASAATLPAWTPEGLVRRVDLAHSTFRICNRAPSARPGAWSVQTVKVDAGTVWTFRTTTPMGTGTALLADIWRGCRVDVELDAAGTTATAVNVHHAQDEGFLTGATATGLTFGWIGRPHLPGADGVTMGPDDMGARTWNYFLDPADSANSFHWWNYGLPSASSAVIQDLVDSIDASHAANLPVMGTCSLAWNTATGTWQASQLVLAPERLNLSVITSAYADSPTVPGTGSMGVTFLAPAATPSIAPMTVYLDYAGDLQTVVESIVWNSQTRVLTLTVPVDHAQWPTLLVPPASAGSGGTRIWVRPVKNGSAYEWHAYNVEVFTVN